jgi:hypothetical protein
MEVQPEEVEALENRVDPRQIRARQVGLSTYWGNFGGATDRYLLFVGHHLGTLGIEGGPSVAISRDALEGRLADVSEKLRTASLEGEVALHLEWLPDA